MNNNGRKRMSSKKAAELSSSSAARTVPRTLSSTPSKVGTEIRNLPDNITLTQEILQNNICRICATYYETGPMLVPLYLCDEGGKPLAKTVNLFLPIKVKESDGMPKFVCRICANKLYAWREMWNTCAEVHKILFSQSEILEGVPSYNRVDTNTLHFVDLMDSSDEEGEGPGDPNSNTGDVGTPLPQDSAEEFVWRYVLGSWAPMT